MFRMSAGPPAHWSRRFGRAAMLRSLALGCLLAGIDPLPADACSARSEATPEELVRHADVIVRARAVDAVIEPATSPGQFPSTWVRLVILEQLKGEERLFDLAVPGVIVPHADFNDRRVPYDLVRSDGRAGSCYARSYQRDGEYLMILKRNNKGELTPYWAPMAANNEQIRGADDPWVVWVRQQLARIESVHRAAARW
jgi:hypothetical protein